MRQWQQLLHCLQEECTTVKACDKELKGMRQEAVARSNSYPEVGCGAVHSFTG